MLVLLYLSKIYIRFQLIWLNHFGNKISRDKPLYAHFPTLLQLGIRLPLYALCLRPPPSKLSSAYSLASNQDWPLASLTFHSSAQIMRMIVLQKLFANRSSSNLPLPLPSNLLILFWIPLLTTDINVRADCFILTWVNKSNYKHEYITVEHKLPYSGVFNSNSFK